jgi:phosphoglycerol transferase MdoB-like AlkP superfamily enzyme
MLGFPRTTFSLSVCLVSLLILSSFRLWLYLNRRSDFPELTAKQRLKIFWVGLRLDAVVVSRACLLLVLAAVLFPDSLFASGWTIFWVYCAALYFGFFLAEIAGLYFFRYYDFRPNYLVFEHGADREVMRAILKAYPVTRILFLALTGMCLALFFAQFLAAMGTDKAVTNLAWYWDRSLSFIWLLMIGFATRGTLDHRPLNPSLASLSANRVANEIAGCGIFTLLHEWGRFSKYEFTPLKSVIDLPRPDEAVQRSRKVLAEQGQFTNDSMNPLLRMVTNGKRAGPLNIVLVVMESFTARLTGCLGGSPALSPQLDMLANEGVLFERCYATGERTVQGLEAAVCSFPPLPGASAVQRPQARHGFVNLASVLKERGYSTLFLYGGQGIFDQMRAFFVGNGFDTFIEEKDFVNPEFKSPWGVSDEDLFHRADHEFRQLHAQGKPFFATLLTVSLHSPWQYPAGRILPLPPNTLVPPGFELAELNNFLYADYCIGKFIRDARRSDYFENTLFVFVGDHGVHLRGRDLIPVDEYRVPALFLAPAHLEPSRIHTPTSQIDLPPTIMGIVGGGYRNAFFGRDVLNGRSGESFAIVIYNKKRYGIVADRELIVLSETGEELAYAQSKDKDSWRQMPMTATLKERAKDAASLLRVAEDLLMSGRYTAAKSPP